MESVFYYAFPFGDSFLVGLPDFLQPKEGGFLVVAVNEDTEIVAYAVVARYEFRLQSAFIKEFYITKEYAEEKITNALLKYVIRYAIDQGIDMLCASIDNQESMRKDLDVNDEFLMQDEEILCYFCNSQEFKESQLAKFTADNYAKNDNVIRLSDKSDPRLLAFAKACDEENKYFPIDAINLRHCLFFAEDDEIYAYLRTDVNEFHSAFFGNVLALDSIRNGKAVINLMTTAINGMLKMVDRMSYVAIERNKSLRRDLYAKVIDTATQVSFQQVLFWLYEDMVESSLNLESRENLSQLNTTLLLEERKKLQAKEIAEGYEMQYLMLLRKPSISSKMYRMLKSGSLDLQGDEEV